MVHPDYQYDPRLVTAMASMIAADVYDVVLGSRIIGKGALQGGMPGLQVRRQPGPDGRSRTSCSARSCRSTTPATARSRASSSKRCRSKRTRNDFVFDNQILAQSFYFGFRVGEVSCPTRYFPEASSIDFRRSCTYGVGVVTTSLQYRAARLGWARPRIFDPAGPRLGAVRTDGGIVAEAPAPAVAACPDAGGGEASVGAADGS